MAEINPEQYSSSFSSMENSLRNMGSVAEKIVPTFGKLFGGSLIADAVVDLAKFEKQFKALSYRMGQANKSSTSFLKNIYSIQGATGAAADEIAEMQKQLIKLRVGGKELNKLTKDSIFFQEITGANADTVGKLTGNLSRMGRMSQKSISGMLTSIVGVQRAFGMTEEEVNELSEGIIESTRVLNQMDKGSSFIEGFNKGVVKLAAGFSSVGLKASEATDLVDRLLDPSKLEDNALLYAKLGISMEDAIAGNIDPDMLQSKLKGLGQELKAMGGPAAAQLAQSMGMPLKQLRQMAEIDMTGVQDAMGGKGLEAAAKEQRTELDKVGKFFTSTGGKVMTWAIGNPLKAGLALGVAMGVGYIKSKKALKSYATGIKEAFTTATAEGLAMGAKRSGVIAGIRREAGMPSGRDRVTGGAGYASAQASAEYLGGIGQEKLSGFQRILAQGAKAESLFAESARRNNKAVYERFTNLKNEFKITQGLRENERERLRTQVSTLQERVNYLDKTNQKGKEYRTLLREIQDHTNQIQTIEQRMNSEKAQYDKMEIKQFNNLSIGRKKAYIDEAKFRQEELLNASKRIKEEFRSSKQRINLINQEKAFLDKQGKLTPMMRSELDREIQDHEKLLNIKREELKVTTKESAKLAMDIRAKGGEIERGAIPLRQGAGASIKAIGANIRSSFSEGMYKMRQGLGRTFEGIERIRSRENIRNMGRLGLRKLGSSLGGITKFIGLASIPMLILGQVLPRIQETLKPLQPLLDGVLNWITKIAQSLIKTLLPPLLNFIAKITPPILRMANVLLPKQFEFSDKQIWKIENSLKNAADDISKVEQNTDPARAGVTLEATGSGWVAVSNAAGSNSSNSGDLTDDEEKQYKKDRAEEAAEREERMLKVLERMDARAERTKNDIESGRTVYGGGSS